MKFADTQAYEPASFQFFMWMNFIFMIIYIPKLVYIIFHFLNYLINLLLKEKIYLIRYAGVLTGMFLILLFAHGAFVNPKNVDVRKVEIEVSNLPIAFDGYKIVQISDIHLGSWGKNFNYMKPVIKKVNEQEADILVFTGDIVNNYSQEMDGWEDSFRQLKSKDGKYAVLGNHDYGDYSQWENEKDKTANLVATKNQIANFGFKLLTNEFVQLHKDSGVIELLGVGNWGKPPFPQYGDLNMALAETDSATLKILLSHDPSHWRGEVLNHRNIFLTLSGHTHAAQIAFNMYGKLRSPSSLVYDEWDGLYQEDERYLYVNRGLGFIGIPVRIGVARPEVSVITLRTKK
jgi:predicted MPP superfamily phosphohydrolase